MLEYLRSFTRFLNIKGRRSRRDRVRLRTKEENRDRGKSWEHGKHISPAATKGSLASAKKKRRNLFGKFQYRFVTSQLRTYLQSLSPGIICQLYGNVLASAYQVRAERTRRLGKEVRCIRIRARRKNSISLSRNIRLTGINGSIMLLDRRNRYSLSRVHSPLAGAAIKGNDTLRTHFTFLLDTPTTVVCNLSEISHWGFEHCVSRIVRESRKKKLKVLQFESERNRSRRTIIFLGEMSMSFRGVTAPDRSSTESRTRRCLGEQRFWHDYHTQSYPKKAAMLSRFLDAARACVRSLFGLVHRLLRPTTIHCTLHPFVY